MLSARLVAGPKNNALLSHKKFMPFLGLPRIHPRIVHLNVRATVASTFPRLVIHRICHFGFLAGRNKTLGPVVLKAFDFVDLIIKGPEAEKLRGFTSCLNNPIALGYGCCALLVAAIIFAGYKTNITTVDWQTTKFQTFADNMKLIGSVVESMRRIIGLVAVLVGLVALVFWGVCEMPCSNWALFCFFFVVLLK